MMRHGGVESHRYESPQKHVASPDQDARTGLCVDMKTQGTPRISSFRIQTIRRKHAQGGAVQAARPPTPVPIRTAAPRNATLTCRMPPSCCRCAVSHWSARYERPESLGKTLISYPRGCRTATIQKLWPPSGPFVRTSSTKPYEFVLCHSAGSIATGSSCRRPIPQFRSQGLASNSSFPVVEIRKLNSGSFCRTSRRFPLSRSHSSQQSRPRDRSSSFFGPAFGPPWGSQRPGSRIVAPACHWLGAANHLR